LSLRQKQNEASQFEFDAPEDINMAFLEIVYNDVSKTKRSIYRGHCLIPLNSLLEEKEKSQMNLNKITRDFFRYLNVEISTIRILIFAVSLPRPSKEDMNPLVLEELQIRKNSCIKEFLRHQVSLF